MIQTLRLTLKLFKREFQYGELSLLFFSLLIATGSMSSIGFLIKRIDTSMSSHANQLNGAQLILKSSTAIPDNWLEKAKELGLAQAQMQIFTSMLVLNNEFKLAQIKAVSDNFPLQGEMNVRKKINSTAAKAPPKGEVWIDKRLALLFKFSLEKNNDEANPRVELGEAEFQVSGILERVPGQSNTLFSIAPTAMINLSDLSLTETIQPGSRVNYLYFFSNSSDSVSSETHQPMNLPAVVLQTSLPANKTEDKFMFEKSLEKYQHWLREKLNPGQSLRSGVEDLKAVNSNLQKAGNFLSLAAVLTILLAAVAIIINAHRYAQKQYKNYAIMLCLGCSEKRIMLIELYKLLTLGIIGSIAGIILGYFVYLGLVTAIDEVISIDSENREKIYWMPVWVSLICGLFLLLSISVSNLLQLKKISPMGLIRKASTFEKISADNKIFISTEKIKSIGYYLMSLLGLFTISVWYTDNISITSLFFLVLTLSSLILYFSAQFLLTHLIQWTRSYRLINRLTLLNLQRHKQAVLLQITTFSLIFALLILIFLVRTELLDKWQQQFPDETPNHFVINVQSDEKAAFNNFLQQQAIKSQGLFPMVRGRLTHLNYRPIKENIPETAQDHNALNRELNLSYAPIFEEIKDVTQISIESSLAKALGIQQGDRLGFRVGSQQLEGIVALIRKVKWDSFQPNFYIIFSPGEIEQYPMTWIASFYLAENEQYKLNQLMEKFPGITMIEVDEILKEVQFIIDKVSNAIEIIFFFIMGAGALILISSLLSTMSSRMYENAVIRTLGASSRQLRYYLWIELLVVALNSAFFAIMLAEFLTYILYQQIFQIDYSLHLFIWPVVFVLSILVICSLGLLVVNKIFNQSAYISLNQYSD
ncbi:MAG: FtsX-like permease family protein [gamma proteobacterium symbiont of Taylorina sp.]|nr:FtsX-like permease family protein [gamma proteobacterium symbiont of Taylorina sp.]